MSRKRLGIAAVVAVVLFAMSPAFQGYHIGRSSVDTKCITRFAIQFCKDEHARIAREAVAAEAREARANAAAAAKECKTVAKEAEEGKRRLFGPNNYYWKCLRPNQTRLEQKWEREYSEESENQQREEQAQKAHKKAKLEAEAASLKERAKRLTEEEERLDKEGKSSQGYEKLKESTNVRQEGEKKLEEAKEVG